MIYLTHDGDPVTPSQGQRWKNKHLRGYFSDTFWGGTEFGTQGYLKTVKGNDKHPKRPITKELLILQFIQGRRHKVYFIYYVSLCDCGCKSSCKSQQEILSRHIDF